MPFSAPSLLLAFVQTKQSKWGPHHQADGEVEVARAVLAAHGLEEVSKCADASLGACCDDGGPVVRRGVDGLRRGCRGRDGSEQVAADCVRCVLFVLMVVFLSMLLVSEWRKG